MFGRQVNGTHRAKQVLQLISSMVVRDISSRHKGMVLGRLWPFLLPLLLLALYGSVFGSVFKARWGNGGDSLHFILMLFPGLLLHGFLSEALSRAPGIIAANVNLVKKVRFPLAILPLVTVLSSLFHVVIGFIVLIIAILFWGGGLSMHMLWLPVVLLPYVALTLGLAWFLSGLGVYLKDIGHLVSLGLSAVLFISPVFYPVDVLPVSIRDVIDWNPVTILVEETRHILLMSMSPDWSRLGPYCIVSVMTMLVGYGWFGRVRTGFADIL